MTALEHAARDFLAHSRIAVAGVSRSGDIPANIIYRKLREQGYEVFAVNPNADEVEGDRCYPELATVPTPIDGVVIATPPGAALDLVRACADLGVPRVWFHRLFGTGSVDEEAVALAQKTGLSVIPGACPMMFCEPVDVPHRCLRWVQRVTGGAPAPQGFD